jgi:sugar/nucleoside kinase (ribokinase family)
MAPATLDVVGIGNAIVDILAHTDDGFLLREGLQKGSMTLIDAERSNALYEKIGPAVECSGGSAANTLAGIAALGGRAGYVGKVADDEFGKLFRHDIRAAGVAFETPAAPDGVPTARSLVLVTPDAQRTMNTYLGISVELGPEDVEPGVIADASITYLEGYLWDPPRAKEAFRQALAIAHQNGRRVALTLSDAFCVERYREEFLDLVEGHVDILFANEAEITSLYQVTGFDEALQKVRGHCEIAALTRSEKGAVIVSNDEIHIVDAADLGPVIDTTGAGDLFASGFLYGLTHGFDLARAGRLGALAAAEVISHLGARPEVPLAPFIEQSAG